MPGVTTGQAVDFLEQQVKKLPAGFSHDYLSDTRLYVREGNQLAITFVFALIIIFLVLAAQFESLRDPLVILVSVPLSICGAMMPLFFGLATMNIYTQVGLVTLIGLISKHGILMVAFANELQVSERLDRRRAIEAGGAGAVAPDPDDDGGDGGRARAAVDRERRRGGEPFFDRRRRRRRHVDRDAVYAVRAAGGLHRAGQGPPRRGAIDPHPRTPASVVTAGGRIQEMCGRPGRTRTCDNTVMSGVF